MENSQEWIALLCGLFDLVGYYISRIDVQTMVLAMLDISWDPRGYLIGCQPRTTLWCMYLEQTSALIEGALGVFRQLPWAQDLAMKKRFQEQSWLDKNPRASQPDTARLVDLDWFLPATMRERKLQYKAIALGIIIDEDCRSFARSILFRYDAEGFKYADNQLLLNSETCEWSMKHDRREVRCKFILKSLILYGDRKKMEKEDVALVEDVILVTVWAWVRAELWL